MKNNEVFDLVSVGNKIKNKITGDIFYFKSLRFDTHAKNQNKQNTAILVCLKNKLKIALDFDPEDKSDYEVIYDDN